MHDEQQNPEQAPARLLPRPLLQIVLGFHVQPGRAQQAVADHQAKPGQQRKRCDPVPTGAGENPAADREALDEVAQHHALGKRGDQRAKAESAVPDPFARARHIAKLEGDAAKQQAEQHHQDREIERRHDHRERQRKYRQQAAAAQNQPGFVEIPDRRHRGHHQMAVGFVLMKQEQDADPEIETVQQHVHQHRQRQNTSPQGHQIKMHRALPVPRAWRYCSPRRRPPAANARPADASLRWPRPMARSGPVFSATSGRRQRSPGS